MSDAVKKLIDEGVVHLGRAATANKETASSELRAYHELLIEAVLTALDERTAADRKTP